MRPEYHIARNVKDDDLEGTLYSMQSQGYQLLSMCPTYLPNLSYKDCEFLLVFVKNQEQV